MSIGPGASVSQVVPACLGGTCQTLFAKAQLLDGTVCASINGTLDVTAPTASEFADTGGIDRAGVQQSISASNDFVLSSVADIISQLTVSMLQLSLRVTAVSQLTGVSAAMPSSPNFSTPSIQDNAAAIQAALAALKNSSNFTVDDLLNLTAQSKASLAAANARLQDDVAAYNAARNGTEQLISVYNATAALAVNVSSQLDNYTHQLADANAAFRNLTVDGLSLTAAALNSIGRQPDAFGPLLNGIGDALSQVPGALAKVAKAVENDIPGLPDLPSLPNPFNGMGGFVNQVLEAIIVCFFICIGACVAFALYKSGLCVYVFRYCKDRHHGGKHYGEVEMDE